MEPAAVSATPMDEAPEVTAVATTTPAINVTGMEAPRLESVAPQSRTTPTGTRPTDAAEEQAPAPAETPIPAEAATLASPGRAPP